MNTKILNAEEYQQLKDLNDGLEIFIPKDSSLYVHENGKTMLIILDRNLKSFEKDDYSDISLEPYTMENEMIQNHHASPKEHFNKTIIIPEQDSSSSEIEYQYLHESSESSKITSLDEHDTDNSMMDTNLPLPPSKQSKCCIQ